MRIISILVLLLLTASKGFGQIDSILAIEGKDYRLKAFIDWATKNIFWRGQEFNDQKIALMSEAVEKFENSGDEKLKREAWFFKELALVGGAMKTVNDPDNFTKAILELAKIAHQRNWLYTEVEFRMAASTVFFNNDKFQEGFEQAHLSNDIIEEIGINNYPEANRFLAEMAVRYYHFTDYEAAIEYFRKAFNIPAPWPKIFRSFDYLNTYGLAFKRLDQFDSAAYYFKAANKEAIHANNPFWVGITNGNLGYLYCDVEKYDEAFPLLLSDFEVSKSNKEFRSAAVAAAALATIYTKRKNISKAEEYFEFSRLHRDTTDVRWQSEYYLRLSHLFEMKGNYKTAFICLDSFRTLKKELARQMNVKLIGHSRLVLQMDKYSSQVKLIESQQRISNLIRNGILTATILVAVISFLSINRIQEKKSNSLRTEQLERKLAAEELQNAKDKVVSFTRLLNQKNRVIEQLKLTVITLPSDDNPLQEDISTQLMQASILTDEDWRRFRELFDRVHPGFFIRLKEKMPGMSASDARVSALYKLNLSQKEMSSMLGIGQDAVRKAKQRLKSKLTLDEEQTVEQFIDSV